MSSRKLSENLALNCMKTSMQYVAVLRDTCATLTSCSRIAFSSRLQASRRLQVSLASGDERAERAVSTLRVIFSYIRWSV